MCDAALLIILVIPFQISIIDRAAKRHMSDEFKCSTFIANKRLFEARRLSSGERPFYTSRVYRSQPSLSLSLMYAHSAFFDAFPRALSLSIMSALFAGLKQLRVIIKAAHL